MTNQEFFKALTKHHGKREPLQDTVSVLSYEVGRMMEHAMYMKWHINDPDYYKVHMGFLKSELMDAIAQIILICESVGVDFEEYRELGIG